MLDNYSQIFFFLTEQAFFLFNHRLCSTTGAKSKVVTQHNTKQLCWLAGYKSLLGATSVTVVGKKREIGWGKVSTDQIARDYKPCTMKRDRY